MQSAKDRLGADGVRLFAAVAGFGIVAVAIPRGRIGNTRTQRHVRTSGVVMGEPGLQYGPQMRFGQRNQPIQTFAPYRAAGTAEGTSTP